MTFGYKVDILKEARTQRSATFADDLLAAIRRKRSGAARDRPLIFLAHSLGGIVVKRALITAKNRSEHYGDIYDATRHLMFFSTPHQGTHSATNLIRHFGAAYSAESSVLRELEIWSPEVLDVNAAFLTSIAPALSITTFWERESTNGIQVSILSRSRIPKTC